MSNIIKIDGVAYNLDDYNAYQQAHRILRETAPPGKLMVYYAIDDRIIPAQFDLMANVAYPHSKLVSRVYVEIMIESGSPKLIFLGAITKKIDPQYVEDMILRTEFKINGVTHQLWINKVVNDNIIVFMPDDPILPYNDKKIEPIKENIDETSESNLQDEYEKTEYGLRRIKKEFRKRRED